MNNTAFSVSLTNLKWFAILVGMLGCLFVGLNLQAKHVILKEGNLDLASIFYLLGAIILILPPIIERSEARFKEDREAEKFAILLIVLEIYLIVSSLFYFVTMPLAAKGLIRACGSIIATAVLKYKLGMLEQFQWKYFYNPIEFVRYHYRCAIGKYGPAYSLSLGIDWLGIGYAFLQFPFGSFALTLGSFFLFVSALRGYLQMKSGISMAWTILNATYVAYGFLFMVYAFVN